MNYFPGTFTITMKKSISMVDSHLHSKLNYYSLPIYLVCFLIMFSLVMQYHDIVPPKPNDFYNYMKSIMTNDIEVMS